MAEENKKCNSLFDSGGRLEKKLPLKQRKPAAVL
jgi:hypothetical protein